MVEPAGKPAADGMTEDPPPGVPTLTLAPGDARILAANAAAMALVGAQTGSLIGRSVEELLFPAERKALRRRLDDVMLLGCDRFAALALRTTAGQAVWVEVQAVYHFLGGQRFEITLTPFVAAGRSTEAVPASGRTGEGASAANATPEAAPPARHHSAGENRPDQVTVPAEPVTGMADLATDRSAAVAEPGQEAKILSLGVMAGGGRAPDGQAQGPKMATETVSQPAGRPAAIASVAAFGSRLAAVMTALDAAGAAAVAVAGDGTILSATVACERLFGIPVARLRGGELERFVRLSEEAAAGFAQARHSRWRRTFTAELASGDQPVTVEWLPEAAVGCGYAIFRPLAPPESTSSADRLQNRLVSFVAHDVRELLANVYCGLRTLAEELSPDAPERASLDRLLAESARASRIVEEVLTVSRPGRLSCVELDVGQVVREVLDRYRPRAASGGIHIVESLAEGLLVYADLSGLERVFGNLIENAIEAMPHAGTLTITCSAEDRGRPGVRISVHDTGMGIPPDIQPNLFEPYVSGKKRGTGLGLASVRRIVLDHEGEIDFETEVGRGTVFHVWLPCATADRSERGT